jgi:hypothetical protein
MILIVVGLAVGSFSALYSIFGRDALDMPHRIHLIDVETGDIYLVDTTKYHLVMPAEHPVTKKICLIRVDKDPSGKWVVSPRSRDTLAGLDPDVKNIAVDGKTGDILVPTKGPTKYSRQWKYE